MNYLFGFRPSSCFYENATGIIVCTEYKHHGYYFDKVISELVNKF